MSRSRLNQYRIMWIFVFFDLPTETKAERKAAQGFRKALLKDGFEMYQFSIYIRNCPSRENAQVHIERVKRLLPKYGRIGVLQVTDRQFGMMTLYDGRKEIALPETHQQLELF
jgi:CRISPR-associated endoribonuclease Cas2